MDYLKVASGFAAASMAPDQPLPQEGFAWLDLAYEEMGSLAERVQRLTGVRLYEGHIEEMKNQAHPSSFENIDGYELLVFRALGPTEDGRRIATRPMFLLNFERLLVTVRPAESHAVEYVKSRFLSIAGKSPASIDELMQRLLSAMVDQYSDLREPITERLERWQRELLDPRRPFNDWTRLVEGRNDLRRLEQLCEEQQDAVQHWRDYRSPEIEEGLRLRFTDLSAQIERVENHARYTEQQAESAVQLYFAANTNRTNEIMRLLTLLTAIFMPLTLITGIFGMNFEFMPGLHAPGAFWLSLAGMGAVLLVMLVFFKLRRLL